MGVFRNGMASARGYIERLGPYQSLLILAIPTSLVEPIKLIAVGVAGEGHWMTPYPDPWRKAVIREEALFMPLTGAGSSFTFGECLTGRGH
jgi:hypothetical protein